MLMSEYYYYTCAHTYMPWDWSEIFFSHQYSSIVNFKNHVFFSVNVRAFSFQFKTHHLKNILHRNIAVVNYSGGSQRSIMATDYCSPIMVDDAYFFSTLVCVRTPDGGWNALRLGCHFVCMSIKMACTFFFFFSL